MARLEVGIVADTRGAKKLVRALKDIKAAAGQTAGTLKATTASATKTGVSLSATATASGQLAASQNLAAAANVAVARTLQATAASATATATAEAAATKSTNALTAAFLRLKTAASGSLAAASLNVKKFATQARTAAGAVAGIGTAVVGLGAAIAVGIGVGVKSAKQFENSLSQIVGLVGLAKSEVEAFKKPIEDIGKATAKGPTELADALFFITSAGARGQDAVDILEASAKAAAAGLGDVATVADAVTSAVNAYGAEAISASQATDVLTATVREGKASADTIAGALGAILPISSELEVSFDQVGAAIAALTRIGLNADEAGTALRATLASIQKPSSQAAETLEEFGTSAAGLRSLIKEEGLLAGLRDLKDRFGDNEEALSKVFPNVRAVTGVLALVGKNGAQVGDIFESLATSTGATDDAFDAYADTAGFKLDKALADIKFALKDIGEEFLPLVAAVATAAAKAFSALATAVTATGDALRRTGEIAEFAGKALAEAFVGSDDPVIRNLNAIRELQDELDRLRDGGSLRKIFTEVGGIDLTGNRREQIAQLEEALRLQRTIELQNGREQLQRQRIAAGLREENDILEEIVVNVKKRGTPVDERLLAQGKKSYASLREEVNFLQTDLTSLQELGQEGIGLAEDFFETQAITRALQGQINVTAADVRKLVNDKRALSDAIDDITEAFARQDAAAQFLEDLATDTTTLQEKFAALSSGGALIDVSSLQEAQRIFNDLSSEDQIGRSPESIAQEIALQEALNTAISSLPTDKVAELTRLQQILLDQQAQVDPESNLFAVYGQAADQLGTSIIDAALAAEGLSGLDQILLDALPKEEQFAQASQRLKDAFNIAGIVDPEDPRLVAALERLEQKIFKTGDIFKEFGIQAARNLQSAFADFLFDPFDQGLDGMIRGFSDTLRRMASEVLSQKILSSLLGSFGGGFGQALQGAFASGGDFSAGKPMLVGEEGPEIITPRRSGTVVPNGMMGQQSAPEVNVAGPTIVNTIDPAEIVGAGLTANGDVILNQVTENRAAFRNALGL